MALDVKRLSRNDQIVAGAGALVLVLSLFDWYSVSFGGRSAGVGAWDLQWLGGKLAVIFSILAAAWVLARASGVDTSMVKAPPRLVSLALAAGAVLLMIIQWTRADDDAGEAFPGFEAGWTIVFYLALLATIAQAVFAYLAFQQDGGMNAVDRAGDTGGTGYGTSPGDYPPAPPTA